MSFGYLVRKQNGRWLVYGERDQIIKRFYTKRTAVQWAEKRALERHVSVKVCKTDGRQDYIFNQHQAEHVAPCLSPLQSGAD